MNTLTAVMKMNIDELKALKMVVDQLIDNKMLGAIRELKVGDQVKVNHKKVTGMMFTVMKINRKKVRVKHTNGSSSFNVPMQLIEKI